MATERQARILLDRANHLRQLLEDLECDCAEWQCDLDCRRAFAKMKAQLDEATLALAMLQPQMTKH